jgi:ribokinase
MQVVVVGSANADLVVRVDRPLAGETVLGGDVATLPGGKGANQAVAAARMAARSSTGVAFVGRVGDDGHGRMLRAGLAASGVDVAALGMSARPTGAAVILLDPAGENSIVVSPGANAEVGPDDARCDLVAGAEVLVLQGEIDPAASLAAAEHTAGRVLLNLAPAGPVPPGLLARTDVLVVNEHEAAELLGEPVGGSGLDPTDAAARLRALGPAAAVVTLGARGAVAVDADGQHRAASAPAVTAVDTTGAGDGLVGAMATMLAQGATVGDALAVGVTAGAFVVTRVGAQAAYPTPDEVWDWLGSRSG